MKNKLVAKLLCITMIAAMVLSCPLGILAQAEETPYAEETTAPEVTETPDISIPEPEVTETSEVTEIPEATETPGVTDTPGVTETPGAAETPDVTETPGATETPGETETPTPVEPDDPIGPETPNVDQEKVDSVVDEIDKLDKLWEKEELTKEDLEKVREAYDALTPEEQALVKNFENLEKLEKLLQEMEGDGDSTDPGDDGWSDAEEDPGYDSDGSASIGSPVSYVGGVVVSNLHAGRTFYLDQLKDTYAISFADDFEKKVMDVIEKEYKEKNKISDDTEIPVRNWQDILAIYILQQKREGKEKIKLNKAAKQDLEAIFEELNPVVRDKKNIFLVSYGNLHVADYIREHKDELKKKEKALLNQYTGKDCALLCCTVTGAKGFIRESAGDEISEERVDVLAAAYSLVGKVGYFWGGKSRVIGWDPNWGTAATVSASGSRTSGSTRAYGLDCSGFVTWAFVNGYEKKKMGDAIGEGTTDQWEHCETIKAKDAQPGDLVFQRGPEAGSNNHVGILVGQTDAGDWIAVHCSSSQNGVTVGEAYSASFRYIRCPSVYPTKQEMIARQKAKEEELMEKSLAVLAGDVVSEKSIISEVDEVEPIQDVAEEK